MVTDYATGLTVSSSKGERFSSACSSYTTRDVSFVAPALLFDLIEFGAYSTRLLIDIISASHRT